jgi:uncharacterized protein (TIGR02246 family)
MSNHSDLELLQIERACERLVTDYCHFVDHGEAARIADLFTEDGVWRAPGVEMKGRDEIRSGFQVRQDNAARMSRHVCNNFSLDVTGDDRAEGVVYLTLYRHDGDPSRKTSPLPGPTMVGEYRDQFARTADGWRIASRRSIVSFIREDG